MTQHDTGPKRVADTPFESTDASPTLDDEATLPDIRRSTEEVFLQDIWEQPDNDTPRLVYADWLGDKAVPPKPTYAAFIRLQVELDRLPLDDVTRAAKIERQAGLLADPEVQAVLAPYENTCRALGELGPKFWVAFRRGCPHFEVEVNGKKRVAAIPALIEALKDRDFDTSNNAFTALKRIGTEAVPALIEALKDQDSNVRRNAICALVGFGADAIEAVPALTQALEDTHGYIQHAALTALAQIRGEL